MQTPTEQNKVSVTREGLKVEDSVLVLNLTPRQLATIASVTSDKKILEDRMNDNSKREKEVVNLILDAHNVDPLIAQEIRMEDGRLIIIKHTPTSLEKGSKSASDLPSIPQNGVVDKVGQK